MGLRGTRQGSGEDYITRTIMICIPHQYYSGDNVGGTCVTYGGQERCMQDIGGET